MVKAFLSRHGHFIALTLILVLAVTLRFYGQNWDQGLYLHPDERFIAIVSSDRVSFPELSDVGSLFDPASSPLNPRRDNASGQPESFAYGTLPLYVQGAASWMLDLVSDQGWGDYDQLYRVGRSLSAVFDVITLIFVYLLARRLFNPTAGLIAAALYALAVLPIQLSHFFTVDIWLTTFVTATLYFGIRFVDQPSLGRSLAVGAVVGCAFATKASVPSLLVPLLAVYVYSLWAHADWGRIAGYALAGGALSLTVFTLFEPYALVRHEPFFEDIRTQARVVRGQFDVPYTRQFVGLTPGIYELKNLFKFTVGPGFLLASLAGIVYGARRVARTREAGLAVILIWIASYVPILLVTEARFLRYTMPLLPVLAVLAGGMLVGWLLSAHWRRLGQLATVLALGITALWGIGFSTIYDSENPRIAASKWMIEHVPPGSVLGTETWDDPLPLRLEGHQTPSYRTQSIDIYSDQPPEEKVDYLYDTLSELDYVILSSDRVIESVDNLPWRYPVQNEYYRRLVNGQLGFRLAYQGELYPELFGISYPDTDADESFTVYDHPRVRIFEKVEQLSREEFRQRLLWGINQPWEPQRYPDQQYLRLGQPVETIETAEDASYNPLAAGNGIVAALFWLLTLEIIGLAILPAAARIFRRAPDRGALSARLLGLLFIGWLLWFGASLRLWPATSAMAAVLVLAVAAVAWGAYVYLGQRRRAPALPGRRAYLYSGLLYFGLFALFLAFRAAYPDFWQTYLGGEKPFELAYLRAITQSTSFPPYDPWFADGVINYYYYGWHLVSAVTKLSGVGITYGFQLASATFAALLGTQIAGLALLIHRQRRTIRTGGARAIAAGLAVATVLFIGNLDALRQVLRLRGTVTEQFDFWGSTRVIDYTINEFPYFSQIWADVHPHVMSMPIMALLLTLLVQVVLDQKDLSRQRVGVHRTPTTPDRALPLAALTLTLGSLIVTNAWDGPLAIALIVAGLAYAGFLVSALTGLLLGLIGVGVVAGAFVLFSPFFVNFYSVTEGIALAEQGSNPGQFLIVWGIFFAIVACALAAEFIRSLYLKRDLTGAWLAAMIILAVGGLAAILFAGRSDTTTAGSYILALLGSTAVVSLAAGVSRPQHFHPVPALAVAGLVAVSGAMVTFRPAGAIALSVTAAGVMMALRRWRRPSSFLPWALIAVGSVTIASTEIVYVVDDLQGGAWQRMNTVFKFSLQAWILLGTGSAVILAGLLQRLRPLSGILTQHRPAGAIARPGQWLQAARQDLLDSLVAWARTGLAGIAVLFVLAGFLYPVFGTPVRLQQDMPSSPESPTLDGYAWMQGGSIQNATGETIDFTGDLAAIEWLNANVDGSPVILEAAIGPYRGNGSRISSGTGLPAVMGWDRHQRQQRFPEGISQRMRDVETLYNQTDPAAKLELLRRYRVQYVVVGDVERYWNTPENPEPYASQQGLAAFEELAGDELSIVFESGSTRIYRVEDFRRRPSAPDAMRQL